MGMEQIKFSNLDETIENFKTIANHLLNNSLEFEKRLNLSFDKTDILYNGEAKKKCINYVRNKYFTLSLSLFPMRLKIN
jgi:hypothetical protein